MLAQGGGRVRLLIANEGCSEFIKEEMMKYFRKALYL